jgi:ABC-type bacteriocin/lantibiotic exporter with double-glycine peptidase domain
MKKIPWKFGAMMVLILIMGSMAVIVSTSPRKGRGRVEPHAHKRPVDTETSCGPVSLAVVAEYLGKPSTIAEFHRATRAGDLGTCSIADLRRALKERGLASTAVRYDPRRPPTHRLPMILFVEGHHFLAALPGQAGRVVIVDAPEEPVVVDWTTLASRWRGEALVVGLDEPDVVAALTPP